MIKEGYICACGKTFLLDISEIPEGKFTIICEECLNKETEKDDWIDSLQLQLSLETLIQRSTSATGTFFVDPNSVKEIKDLLRKKRSADMVRSFDQGFRACLEVNGKDRIAFGNERVRAISKFKKQEDIE